MIIRVGIYVYYEKKPLVKLKKKYCVSNNLGPIKITITLLLKK